MIVNMYICIYDIYISTYVCVCVFDGKLKVWSEKTHFEQPFRKLKNTNYKENRKN